MAWNRPSEDKARARISGEQRNVHLKGLLAGAAVVIGAAVAWWLFLSDSVGRGVTRPVAPKSDKRQIPSVQRHATGTNAPAQVVDEQPKKKTLLEKIRARYGDNIPENLKMTVYYLEHPAKYKFKPSPTRGSIFQHTSEQMIADIALVEPGTMFVIQPEFDSSFDRDFVNAMLDKIDIYDTDTEEQRALKEEVAATKAEIAKMCREQGCQPSVILNQHAKTLYELGNYRRNLENELNEMHDKAEYSDSDIADFYAAANKMLKEKGLPEMVSPDLTKRSIRLARLERRKQKEARENEAKESQKE